MTSMTMRHHILAQAKRRTVLVFVVLFALAPVFPALAAQENIAPSPHAIEQLPSDSKEADVKTDEPERQPPEPGELPDDEGDKTPPPEHSEEEEPQSAQLSVVTPAASSTNLTPSTIKQLLPSADESTGALIYQYPITIPPGRNGLQPAVSLSYNNQQTDDASLVGHGWSLAAPSIERLNKTGSDELYNTSYFTSSLSGELVSLTASTFGSKIDNGEFLDYTFAGNVWTVRDKKGTIYTFGATTASRQDDSSDPAHVYKWMLSEIRDRNDNFISYTYDKVSGQIYPSTITYTGHGISSGMFSVEFIRETRPDVSTSYKTAFLVTTGERVSEIQAKINGSLTRSYDLAYGLGDNGVRSLLTSITETGYDSAGNPTSTPAVTIEYQTTAPGWSPGGTWEAPVGFAMQNMACNNLGSRVADINGDGLPDILQSRIDSANTAWQSVYLNNGAGWTLDPSWVIPRAFGYTGWCSGDYGSEVVDINGDALADIIHYRIFSNSSAYERQVYLNTGSGWVEDFTWTIPHPLRLDFSDWGTRLADVNGDGLTDFVWSKGNDRGVALNTGSNWVVDPSWSVPIIFTLDSLFVRGTEVRDVNGDGLSDLIESETNSPSSQGVYVNTGSGWVFHPSWIFPVPLRINSFADYGTRLADINSDGLPDVLVGRATSINQFEAYMNTGSGWVPVPAWLPLPSVFSAGGFGSDTGVRLVDVNGDGMTDFVKSVDTGSSLLNDTWLANGERSDRMIEMTASSGGTTSIEYATPQEMIAGPALLNPETPFVFDVVSEIERDNGFGAVSTYSYLYEGGDYDSSILLDRKFAGFHSVAKTDLPGNTMTTWYHQGNGTDSSLGESSDHASKIGKAFRVEMENAAGSLVRAVINNWDRFDLGNSRSFVKLSQTTALNYDGNATHRDSATTYTYNNANGNVLTRVEWGEVSAASNGSFSDLGADKRTTTVSYAANAAYHILGLPSQEIITDQSGAKLLETKSYYDGLALGSVSVGNPTKEERWKTGSSYMDVERAYNSYGFMTQELDPLNRVTTYAPDAYNLYPTMVTNALGYATSYLYDYSLGRPSQITDPNGGISQTIYDGLDRVIEEKQSNPTTASILETKTTYSYTPQAVGMRTLKTDHLDATNARDTYTYTDGFDRPIQTRAETETSNAYAVSDTIYDTREYLWKQSLPYFSTGISRTSPTVTPALLSTFTYDALGRTTSIATVVGNTATSYDQWISTVTDPRGKVKSFTKDAYDRLVTVVENNSSSAYTTTYVYNGRGDLTSLTDALGNIRSFTYDGLSRRLTAQDLHAPADATFGTWTYTYDDAGNLISSVNPKSQTVQYTYDFLQRPLTENFTGATGIEVTNTYDACTNGIGRLCSVSKTGFSETRQYDELGRMSSQTRTIEGAPYATSFIYDRQGNQLTLTNPDSSQVQYVYNSAGLLNQVNRKESTTSSTPVVSNMDYTPTGKRTVSTYANGTTTTNTYDANELYRLRTKITNTPSGNQQYLTYTYDPNGNVTQITDTSSTLSAKTTAYTYDDLNRLLSASVTGAANGQNGTQNYTYNAVGNILTRSDAAGAYSYTGNVGSNYANPHAVTATPAASYTYDQNGNLATSVVPTAVTTTPSVTPPWYAGAPASWAKRLPLTVQQTQINGTTALASFPLLVSRTNTNLRSTGNGGFVASTSGNDILFTASNGITKLDHEIEKYNPTTGELIAWVRIPSLSATVNTSVYLYFGNASAPNQQNSSGVWGTTYKGVWHMDENPTGSGAPITDSTSNAYHGTPYGSMPASASVAAKVGQGLTFDGSNDYVNTGTAASVNTLTNNFTVSAWVRPTSLSGTRRFISAARTASNNGFGFGTYGTYPRFSTYGVKNYTRSTALSLNAWAKLDAVMQNNNVLFYRNGVYLGTITNTSGGIANTDDTLRLGASTSTGSSTVAELFKGTLDEVRVCQCVRNQYWIQAEYNNQNAQTSFVTFGTIQSIPVPVTTITNVTTTYAWDYGNRLTTITSPTLSASFLYDPDGTRVRSVLGGVTTKTPTTWYSYVGMTPTKHILTPDGEMLATVEGSNAAATISYIHTDHLTGSAVAMNASGAQLQLLDYHPFGTLRLNNQSSTFNEKRKFAGHEYDTETGLSYMVARYYHPATGRFLSEDPAFLTLPVDKLPILLTDPQQWNSYAYGRDNPLTYRDPDGNFIETVVDVAIGLYDVGSFAFWGVQTGGTLGAIGLTNLFGGESTRLHQQLDHASGKLLNTTINVGIDAVGTAIPFVPAVGLRAGVKAADGGLNATHNLKTFLEHVDVKSFGKTIYSGSRDIGSTLKKIEQGALHGKVYRNEQNILPAQPRGYYKEYEVKTPNWARQGKGPERIFQGKKGETYYSPDHMQSSPIRLDNQK